jgi:hypothetical protein
MRSLITILAVSLLSTAAHASGPSRTIDSLTIDRDGGGSVSMVFSRDLAGNIVGYTQNCGFKPLPKNDQDKTRFYVTGSALQESLAVFENKASFAEAVQLDPPLLTGTWVHAVVNYRYTDVQGNEKMGEAKINTPYVLIGGRVSKILGMLEVQARAAAKDVCP